MVMIITHIAYNTCFVTNDAWHAYDVIWVYKIQDKTIRLKKSPGQEDKTIGQKMCCID